MCSVVQYPPTAACSRGCRDCSWRRPAVLWLVLASGRDLRWPPMTSGAPTPSIQSGPGSAARVTCPVSCVTCDVLQSGDVEMWREAIKLCSSSPQHSYLLRIENMRCWETAVGETLRQWDWAEPEMRREILYLGAGVRGCVASVWRLISVTWWRDVTPTWRFNDSLQRNLSHPKVWTSILFLFLPLDKCRELLFWSRSNWIIGAQQYSSVEPVELTNCDINVQYSAVTPPIETFLDKHPNLRRRNNV